jgi:hypothetical protein
MNFPGFVLAYHGCDRAVGERIVSGEEHVRASANDYDWLGSGAYFWEHSPRRALEWAEFLRDHPEYAQAPVTTPFVIGAIIQPGWTLDLTDTSCLRILRKAYEDLVETMADLETDLPQNEMGHSRDIDFVKRKLDCAVINYLHLIRAETRRQPFDCVRGAFFEGGSLYPGAGMAAKAHIQWCVRDPVQNIRGYFVPLPGWEEQLELPG